MKVAYAGRLMSDDLRTRIEQALTATPPITWSVSVRTGDGNKLVSHADDVRLGTASVGKLLLLIEVARRFELDPSLRTTLLSRSDAPEVAESGLWQHLEVNALPMADVAVLAASVSDNWATNVLLEEVGLDSVRAIQKSLDLVETALLDRVRDHRTAADPDHLSVGTAAELSMLMARLHRGDVVSPGVSQTVRSWLSLNADLSMVASPWGLDPLAHTSSSPLRLFNKTGSDAGVRADIGVLEGPREIVAYGMVANWPVDHEGLADSVYDAMRMVGKALSAHVREQGDASSR